MAEARAEHGFQVRSRTAAWALERAYVAAPLVLRLGIGTVIFAHGLQKLMGPGEVAQGYAAMGIRPGMLFAVLVGLIETLGGAGLLLGFFTRLSAFANIVVQTVALIVVHIPNGFFLNWTGGPGGHGIEFTLSNLACLLALLILGGGTLSVDHMVRSRSGRLEARRTATPTTTPAATAPPTTTTKASTFPTKAPDTPPPSTPTTPKGTRV